MISLEYNRRIASNYLLYRGELLRNGVVEIDSSGKILSVGSSPEIDRLPNTEFYSGVLMAGMVNAHSHIELSYLRGAITQRCGFASFASQMAAVRDNFSPEQVANAIAQADIDMYNQGVVAVGDISNGAASAEVKRRSSICYHTFVEHFGLRRESTEHLTDLLSMERSSLTPHSTYSVSDRVFREIALSGDAPLSIHFMESEGERELFEGRGELFDSFARSGLECDFLHYGSPARRIVESIPATRSVILVHNTVVSEDDINLIMNHFTAPVYWVVSPRSNRYISGGQPPIEMMLTMGLNIAIGTDSMASNHSLSMIEELACFNNVGLAERLMWATANGAKALGMDNLGAIEVGQRPSLVILSGVDVASGQIGDKSRFERLKI